jgi:potassium-transporting ATPase potassium-binding subunit
VTLDAVSVVITLAVLAGAAWLLGEHMAAVFSGRFAPWLRPVRALERGIHRVIGLREDHEQSWWRYLVSMLVLTLVTVVAGYAVLRLQDRLPLNPAGAPAMPADLSLDTAISFATNTSWQNYAGEQALTYLSQMLVITALSFSSAATGIALAIAFIRGLARRRARTLGNFHVDVIRATLYVLLPVCVLGTLVLLSRGAVQTLSGPATAHTLSGVEQLIARGPVASQEVIKDLSGDGGGFFNANSAHPFENPDGFTNQLEILLQLLIPSALAITFGRMVGNLRQGLAVAAAMAVIVAGAMTLSTWAEQHGNHALDTVAVRQAAGPGLSGGNMEGKEVRLGAAGSAEFAVAGTASGDGAVNGSTDSFMPLGSVAPLLLMQIGEIAPGGTGSGLYGMLIVAIMAVFVAGLMVGRTPEYIGKKIQSREVKLVALSILIMPATVLAFSAVSVLASRGRAGPSNPGAHGFTEVLYAFSSASANNGSAFAGLNGNTLYYNTTLAVAMWLGRIMVAIPMLALAGSLAAKPTVPASSGTLRTDTPLFTVLLVGVITIVVGLVFFPADTLGPLLDHLSGVNR